MPEHVGASHAGSAGMIGLTCTLLALSWTAVALRVYVRKFVIKTFGLDDWLMLITLAFSTTACLLLLAIECITMSKSLGDLKWLTKATTYVLPEIALYILTTIFLKLSLAVFFLRVVVERWQRWIIYIGVAIYTIYTTCHLFIAVFQCGNPAHYFELNIQGKCIGWDVLGPMNYVHGILNALTDWMFAILPICLVHKANMPLRAKISVSIIMGLGTLGSIASVFRLVYMDGLMPRSNNFLADTAKITTASIIEPALGIIAGSLATLRPLLRNIRARINISSETEGSMTKARPEPQIVGAIDLENCEKQQGSFASSGYSEDTNQYGGATFITMASDSTVEIVKDTKAEEEVCTEMEPTFLSEACTPSWARISYSTMSSARKESMSSRIGPLTLYPRKFSIASMRRNSRATTSYRKGSEAWVQKQNPQRETWSGFGFDIEAAKKNWNDRALDHRGDARIWPSLLLPDIDADDNIIEV